MNRVPPPPRVFFTAPELTRLRDRLAAVEEATDEVLSELAARVRALEQWVKDDYDRGDGWKR
jgi:hypothetical protein